MNLAPIPRLNKYLRILLITLPVLYIIIFIIISIIRIQYPYELEWMEGSSLEHVIRILAGKPLYVEPSLQFTPYIYPPLFYYLSAFIALFTGIGFFPMRLVSLLSTLISGFIIYKFVKRETNDRLSGLISSGLYFATFQMGAAWFDVGRVDNLALTFILASIYLLRYSHKSFLIILSGIFAVLSFFTKQSSSIIILSVIIGLFFTDKRKMWFYGATFLLITISLILMINHSTGGWFNFYIFYLPGQHKLLVKTTYNFWINGILKPMPIAFGLSILYFIFKSDSQNIKKIVFYVSIFAGAMWYSWFSIMHEGGYDNVLIPCFAIIAVFFGIAYKVLNDVVFSSSNENKPILISIFYIIIISQFFALFYNPSALVPKQRDVLAGNELFDKIKSYNGNVYVNCHPYLQRLAGQNSMATAMALWDVMRASPKYKIILTDELSLKFQNHVFDAIITDEDWQPPGIEKYYKLEGSLFNDKKSFYTLSGSKTRPEFLWLPKVSNGR
jgi:hypothetical protein